MGVPVQSGTGPPRDPWWLAPGITWYDGLAGRIGAGDRELLARLALRDDRKRRVVEHRVSASVDSRGGLDRQEPFRAPADGDPALWGGSS